MNNQDSYLIDSKVIKDFCKKSFIKVGIPEKDAELVSDLLIEADLRGYSTHGVVRFGTYLEYIKRGVINPTPALQKIRDDMATSVLDGDNGMGQIAASYGMDVAIEKASQFGIGIVGVQNSGHLGALGLIAKRVVPHNMIGIVLTNGGPVMAAWGGSKPILGNNPFAVCIPRNDGPDVLIDMALSTTARGNIIIAEREGKTIPEGWAINKDGEATTDPTEALLGSVLPMAGHKGYALALTMELLTSVLVGGLPGYSLGLLAPPQYDRHLGNSNTILAIDIKRFIEWNHFQENITEVLQNIKNSAKDTENIYIPGERSEVKRKQALENGVTLTRNVYQELLKISNELNVPLKV